MFHRHPVLPEVHNACPLTDFELGNPEEDIDSAVNKMKAVNEKVLQNIERAQQRQMKGFATRKGKKLPVRPIGVGDQVLVSQNPRNKTLTEGLSARHRGPYTVVGLSGKGVATITTEKGTRQKHNISRLKPYHRVESHDCQRLSVYHDHHGYNSCSLKQDHGYAWLGDKWAKDAGPFQDALLKYVLDTIRPANELLVKDGEVCLLREDFWSLGLNRCMDSTIGNACLKLVREAALTHGKDVHIVDMFVVPTWKADADPLSNLPDNVRSRDAILFPAWSRQPGRGDHYLLCVE
ncbi:uncharacterized protein PAE49_021270 [Odontesthes bonariensis]|uniref:uncharacterized protein LOC142369304 n=1 Tax=Odontesthes bonariensis TaxID=219752 RepID=UPI003F58EA92